MSNEMEKHCRREWSSLSMTCIYCHGILPVGLNKITKIPRYVSRNPERNLKLEIHTYEAELDNGNLSN